MERNKNFSGPRRPKAEDSNQMVFGIRAVMEAIEAGKEIETLFIQRNLTGDLLGQLLKLAHRHKVVIQKVPEEKLNRLTRKVHQGAVAFVSPIIFQNIGEIITGTFEKGESPFVIILEGVTDVRNFGAIARSAYCAGCHAIIIPTRGAARINSDAIKTSAGALHHLPVVREVNLNNTVRFLKESGLTIVGCTEKATETIYKTNLTGPLAVVMGAEDVGLSNDMLKATDYITKIPMPGQLDSLNVSVATGIVLFESIRQKELEAGA